MVRYLAIFFITFLFAFNANSQALFDAYFDNGEEQDKKIQQIQNDPVLQPQQDEGVNDQQYNGLDDAYSPANDPTNDNAGGYQAIDPQGTFKVFTEKTTVPSEQPFKIIMELENADAYSAPDTSVLPSELKVQTQSQQTSVNYVNGVSTKKTKWILEVVAESPGSYAVPPISIQTDIGTLYSNSFGITAKDVGELPANTDDNTVFIEASAKKKELFIGEPIEYKVKVYHLYPIDVPELVKPKSDDLKIEQITEAKKGQESLNGQQYNTLEVSFLVTPSVSGKIKIEPSILRGKILKEVKRKRPRTAFDDFFDPFAVIDNAFSVTREVQDFTVASNKITLNVKPSVDSVEPWMALYDLQIEDELLDLKSDANSKIEAKVGEPISRKIVVTAIGRKGDDIPTIENYISSPDFKIYSDKPATEQKVLTQVEGPIASKIKGIKSQSFTFIPQKQGELTLPEIKMAYYSIPEDKIKYAVLPGKKLSVKKGDANYQYKQPIEGKAEKKSTTSDAKDIVSGEEQDNFHYVRLIIFILLGVIAYLIYKVYELKKAVKEMPAQVGDVKNNVIARKIGGNISPSSQPKEIAVLKEIRISENFKMLEKAIKKFALMKLAVPENSSVTIAGQQIARHYKISRNEVVKLCAELDAAIYTDKNTNFEELKSKFINIFSKVEDKDMEPALKKKKKLAPLNPL